MKINKTIDTRIRRAAKKLGLIVQKSRKAYCPLRNQGGYMLVNPFTNTVVDGQSFDLTPGDVLGLCSK